MYDSKMLIDGELVPSLSGNVAHIYNPANGDLVATVPKGNRNDASLALNTAKRAFPLWAKTNSQTRGDILHEGAKVVRQRAEQIASLLTQEQGKPLKDAKKEVLASAEFFDYYAEEGKRIFGEWLPTQSPNTRSLVIKQPIGVAALITPWNYPVYLLALKMAPALAAGCTFVAKPASNAPLAATELIKALFDAGTPTGVVNVILGPGSEVGAELVENPISRKVSFTGESETGRWIMRHAAQSVKRLSLELGGHSPFIVCKDADLDDAAKSCLWRAFSNMGQVCVSVNRIYVDEEVFDEFSSVLVQLTQKLKLGNGMDPEVDLGPMFNEDQRQKTKEHITDAVNKGAKVLCGGDEPEGAEYEKGFFFLPTVLSNVNHSMKIMQEETFGPVAPIMTFKDLGEALRLANDSQYGLAAYLYTNDLSTAIYASEMLEVGSVGVNVNNVMDLQAPFGGWKQSGLGREHSRHALEEFLEKKHIRVKL